ncbi:hypothetical protein ACOMHN_029159 [Nucella lapillus]
MVRANLSCVIGVCIGFALSWMLSTFKTITLSSFSHQLRFLDSRDDPSRYGTVNSSSDRGDARLVSEERGGDGGRVVKFEDQHLHHGE